MNQQESANRPRIEKRPEVEQRTKMTRSGIYAGMAAGTFPKAVKLSAKAVGWHSDEIDAWIASRPRATAE